MRFALPAVALLAVAALICVPSGAGASKARGYVEVYLDYNTSQPFVLNQSAPATFVFNNRSSIVYKNATAILSSEDDVVVKSVPSCKKIITDQGNPGCMWTIHWVKPGGHFRPKLTLMFKSSHYAGASQAVLELQVHNKTRLADFIFAWVNLSAE